MRYSKTQFVRFPMHSLAGLCIRAGGALTEVGRHHKVESRAVRVCVSVVCCLLSKTIRHSRAKLSGFGFMGQLLRSKGPKSAPIGGIRSFVNPLAKVAHRHLWFSTSIWISNWRCKFRIFLILEDGSTQNLLECVPISLKPHRECLPAPLPCTAGSSYFEKNKLETHKLNLL